MFDAAHAQMGRPSSTGAWRVRALLAGLLAVLLSLTGLGATTDAVESNPLSNLPANSTDTALTSTDNDDQAVLTVAASGTPAYTGAEGIGGILTLGLVLLAAGGGLLLARRRRAAN